MKEESRNNKLLLSIQKKDIDKILSKNQTEYIAENEKTCHTKQGMLTLESDLGIKEIEPKNKRKLNLDIFNSMITFLKILLIS